MTIETMYHELTEIVRSKHPEGFINFSARASSYGNGFEKKLMVSIWKYQGSSIDQLEAVRYSTLKGMVQDWAGTDQEEIDV